MKSTFVIKLLRFKFPLFLLLCFLLNINFVSAQEIIIEGQITDAHSAEPIPFANVFIPEDPSLGVSADYDGNYKLTLPKIPDTLIASAVGYHNKKIAYRKDQIPFHIKLEATAYSLEEIVVRPTEDPAVAIFKKILENKKQNNPKNIDHYQCEIYNKLELDLVEISEEFKNLKINRPFSFIFEKIDSTSEELPFLPAFLSETLSDYYYKSHPKTEKEHIKASKISGLKNASFSQFMGVMYANINVYDNWIPILSKDFVSPISNNGFNYYRYYVVDSATIQNDYCYQIQFYQKSKSSNTFRGDFWVDTLSYGIKRINFQLFEDAELNFVKKISIIQDFEHWNNKVWIPRKDFIVVTFDKITEPLFLNAFSKKIEKAAPNIQGKRSTSYQKYNLNIDSADSVSTKVGLSIEALDKSDEYWEAHRHSALSENEKVAHSLIDTIRELPVMKAWKTWTSLIFGGHLPVGPIDIGNLYSIYSTNPVEGGRFRVGIRTNSKFSKKLLLAGYAAYGLKDDRFKFGINTLFLFNKSPRQTLTATVIHDIRQTPELDANFSISSEGFLTPEFIRQSKIPFKLIDLRYYRLNYFRENKKGLSVQTDIEHQETNPYFNFQYQTNDTDTYQDTIIKSFRHTAIGLKIRFAAHEKHLTGTFNRISLGSEFPAISLRYKLGLKDFLDGGFSFHKFELDFYDRMSLAPLGYMKVNAVAGQIIGRLPYLLLEIPKGNEGYFYNTDGFNLISQFTFAMDRYAQVSFDHHLDGFFFEKIPLLKKLNVRLVNNFRMLWGDMNKENRLANAANLFENTDISDVARLRVPNNEPYMEIGTGVENILRILRIDVVWRLNYHEIDDTRWGIKANLHLKF